MLAATLLTLVATDFIRIKPTQDDFVKYLKPEDSRWKIAGCAIGMTKLQVYATLGQPHQEMDEGPSTGTSTAWFIIKDSQGVSLNHNLWFEDGRVSAIAGFDDHQGTTMPGIGTSRKSVINVLGEPDPGSTQIYPRFQRGLVATMFDGDKLYSYSLSIGGRADFIRRTAPKNALSDQLVPKVNYCVAAFPKGEPTRILNVQTTVAVQNKRKVKTKVKVRIAFKDKTGKIVGSAEKTDTVGASDVERFELTTEKVKGDARAITYNVTVAAVKG